MNKRLLAICTLLASFCDCVMAVGHSTVETNEIVRCMLSPLLVRPHFDTKTQSFKSTPKPILSQEDFFACRTGWTSEELQGAFDWYIETLPDLSEAPQVLSRGLFCDPIVEAIIAQCDAISYTNALGAIEAFVSGDSQVSKKSASLFVIRHRHLDDSLLDFVASIATNCVKYSMQERNAVYLGYVAKLKTESDSLEKDNGLMFLHFNRHDLAGAVAIDTALSNGYNDYHSSTERFLTAINIISDTNAWEGVRQYFSAVTNEVQFPGVICN